MSETPRDTTERTDRFQRAREVFLAAAALGDEERDAYVDRMCTEDGDLRAEVEALLAHDSEPTPDPVVAAATRVARGGSGDVGNALVGKRVGPFSIKSVIASGGMGTVYLAVQESPHRKVALKVMARGIASRSALRRFEFESQTLARLRHPNVAQVYEAGTHDDGAGGVPYFAMEYVPGARTITEYAVEKGLGTRERLALFAKVCSAIHHGHQKGIIHRDLKPGNILVDTRGEPKIIDFGVARATDSDLAVTTLQTDIGQLIGTLQYMSPEQCAADPDDIDTRSDVYALGVVLYELLCGRVPYDVSGSALHEAARVIQEEAPARPSTIDRTLRGDVETITLKAMEKDRDRRYSSAEALGEDIRRYLGNEPIQARPPTLRYQLATFARRNRPLVVGTAAVFVALLAGIVATSVALAQANRARTEAVAAREAEVEQRRVAEANEETARTEQAKAEQVALFTQEMLSGIDPRTARDLDKTLMRMVLDESAARIGTGLTEQPEVEASIRGTIGVSYKAIGVYPEAQLHLERSLELHRTLRVMSSLANLYKGQGRYDEAEPLYLEAVETSRRVLGEEDPQTLSFMNNLATLYRRQRRYDEAEVLSLKTLEIKRRVLGNEHESTLASIGTLASLYRSQGRHDRAEALFVEALVTSRRVLGDTDPMTIRAMNNLANLYSVQDRSDEAEPLYREMLEVSRRVFGEEHPSTIRAMRNLAILYHRQDRFDEAEPLYVEALEMSRRVLGEEDPLTIRFMSNLADLYAVQGRTDEARPLVRALLAHSLRTAEAEDASASEKNACAVQLLTCAPADLRDPTTALALALAASDMTGHADPEILDTLSLAYHLNGETAKAIENQTKAIGLLPPGASDRRATLEAALAEFETALAGQSD